MTNDETHTDRIATYLADAYLALIDNDDLDYEPHDRLIEVIEVLPAEVATSMLLALEMCPMHYCDIQICIDDEDNECRAHWDEPVTEVAPNVFVINHRNEND